MVWCVLEWFCLWAYSCEELPWPLASSLCQSVGNGAPVFPFTSRISGSCCLGIWDWGGIFLHPCAAMHRVIEVCNICTSHPHHCVDQRCTVQSLAVWREVTYVWPQWLLFPLHSSSQGGISVLLDWSSGYSYLIFCFQAVDFPAVPTEAVILWLRCTKQTFRISFAGNIKVNSGKNLFSAVRKMGGIISTASCVMVESILTLPGELCSALVCLHKHVLVTVFWPCHSRWNRVVQYSSLLLHGNVCVSCVCVCIHPKHVVYIFYQFALRRKLASHGATCSLMERTGLELEYWWVGSAVREAQPRVSCQRDTRDCKQREELGPHLLKYCSSPWKFAGDTSTQEWSFYEILFFLYCGLFWESISGPRPNVSVLKSNWWGVFSSLLCFFFSNAPAIIWQLCTTYGTGGVFQSSLRLSETSGLHDRLEPRDCVFCTCQSTVTWSICWLLN